MTDLPSRPLHEWTCIQIASAVRTGDVSAGEVVEHHLERIARAGHLNAFITTVEPERALADAASLRRSGRMGALAGVPFAPKDLFETVGLRTTYGSQIYRDHVSTWTATAVQRCVDAGAILVGKANMHEFAWGVTTKNPYYGVAQNPRHAGRIAGGSSGGSAVAVAAGLAALSLGTDTGGSIRIPAAACGISGFKGSYGLVSTDGCFPLVRGMDHVGPMARSMEECALTLSVLCDLPVPVPSLAGLHVGLLHDFAASARLADLGARVEAATIPASEHLLPVFPVWAAHCHRDIWAAHQDEYSDDLRAKFAPGFSVSAHEYLGLVDELALWKRRCEAQLPFDVMVNPTITCELPSVDEHEDGALRLRVTVYTRPFNFLGWPSCTTRDGLMWSGRDDATVLGAALAWEETLPPVEVCEVA